MANPSAALSPTTKVQAAARLNSVHLSRPRLALLTIVPWFVVVLLLGTIVFGHFESRKPARAIPANEPVNPESTRGIPGPWGQLEYRTIRIDLPGEYVFKLPSDFPPVRWFFHGYSKERAVEFLRSAGITTAQLAALQKAGWTTEAAGVAVAPGDELILALTPETRAKIYSLLVEFPENARQIDPVWFQTGQVEERLKDSGLSASSLKLLKGLLYPQGPSLLLFADFEPALRQIAGDRERYRFVQAVSRKKTLLARLRIDADSKLDSIADYWGVGGRKKDVAPLLAALRHEGNAGVQIICLLPAFAREHLYTYPLAHDAGSTTAVQDCFWTAMNFFDDTPGHCPIGTHDVETLNRDYNNILTPTQLGDTIFLATRDGVPVHAAVYIADDIVFTKNGGSLTQPWILMHMQDMLDTYAVKYPRSGPLKIFYYRKKTL